MLIGLAGTKKSTAIKIGSKILKSAGYDKFAADKTRQEKFLCDLAEGMNSLSPEDGPMSVDDILDQNLFGEGSDDAMLIPREAFVNADEVNNFIGVGNLDFMSILGDLWDYDGTYEYRLKNSKSVYIPYPTINILGGNTHAGFNRLFPAEAIEQGFFSRMLFIYGEPTGVKYTIPPAPCEDLQAKLIQQLHEIKTKVSGEMSLNPDAYELLDEIYKSGRSMNDSRFDAYENRRLVHLLKLTMLVAASRLTLVIDREAVIEANTVLSYTENLMPKALGEFGKAKNSGVTHKVMQVIDDTDLPISFKDIWKCIHQDLDSRDQLGLILGNLEAADKIQTVGNSGFLPRKVIREQGIPGSVDWSYLTNEERGI